MEKFFKTQLVAFMDDLISIFPSHQTFVMYRLLINNDTVRVSEIVPVFRKCFAENAQRIEARDERFFTSPNPVFEMINVSMGELWVSKAMTEHNKRAMWDWIAVLSKIVSKIKN